jgi:hypothetical protein
VHGEKGYSMIAALVHPSPAMQVSGTLLQKQSQKTFACLAVSHQRIEQSDRLMRTIRGALARRHAAGMRSAGWQLRLDSDTLCGH